MEQMMGVREGLPDVLLDSLKTQGARERFRDGCRLALTTCGLVLNHFTLPSGIRNFHRRLNLALKTPDQPIEDARPDELAAHYHSLEGQLLCRWDAPIINDFFAMIFYGVLRRLTARWCADESGTLPNDLLCGEGGIISAEPARRLGALAAIAARHPGLVQQLTGGDRFAIEQEIRKLPSIETGCREYLRLFGDRCIDELKLESATLNEDPLPFYRSLGQFARRLSGLSNPQPPFSQTGTRAEAEARIHQALKRHPIRRIVLRWILQHARERIRNRENLRFERTRVFGRVRQLFLALGRQFHERGLLQSERDIFFLEVNEALGYINGTVTSINLKALATLRRAEFERYEKLPPPSERFETRGMVHHGNVFRMAAARIAGSQGEERRGMGCSPGFVSGPVRIVRDPRTASLDPGEILVAERTDPGWILVFPAAAGLIVERGSMLSHSAIVARELGIPAVVSIPGLTEWLKDGDWVEMDGSTGQVNRVIPAT
jgi:pyruvate,water dikinase